MRLFAVLLILLNVGYFAREQGWILEKPAAPPAPAGPPPFTQADQRLVLLEELPLDQLAVLEQIAYSRTRISGAQERLADVQQQAVDVQQQIDENAVPAPVVPWCASVGVFMDERAAADYIDRLEELGGQGMPDAREEPVSSTWWVHIPPLPSEADARVLLDELQGKNIDSYYMRTGELAGGISLGVFSREESALTAQRQLEGRGYTTNVREIFRLGARVYVDVTVPDSALVASPAWSDFLASEPGLQVTEKACEEIAPENQFP